MKKYDCVIFDLDGTLLNTLGDLTDAVNFVMEHFGMEFRSERQVRSFLGNGIRKLMQLCVPNGEQNPRFEEAFSAFKTYYTEHCQIKTAPYAGVSEMLLQLKKERYGIAVVSNKNDEAVKTLCSRFFGDVVDVVVGENSKRAKKPAPDMVNAALQELQCIAQRALYVGDSEVDTLTAKNSLLNCVLVSWGFRDKEVLESLSSCGIIDFPNELWMYL